MKKQILSGLLLALSAYGANAQYGFSTPIPITTNLGGTPAVYNLTSCTTAPQGTYLAGAVWNTVTVDFTSSFTLEYDAQVKLVYNYGADGYCVVFKENPSLTSVGGAAGYIGYYNASSSDFVNSFGIEFDDFDNLGGIGDPSPYFDHIAIAKNGSYAPGDILASPVPILPSAGTIQDGAYHHYKIEWLCGLNTLNVYVDNNKRTSTNNFDYRTLFSNPASVTWGFTSGIGASGSDHLLRNVTMTKGASCAQQGCVYNPKIIASSLVGGATQFDLTPNAGGYVLIAGYIWDFMDGTPTVTTTSPTVTHTYSGGLANVTVKILGYNTQTGECCSYTYTYRSGKRMAPQGDNTADNGGITVTPNPGNGRFDISSDFKFSNLQLIDMSGRKLIDISRGSTQAESLDLSNYTSGIYMLMVQDEKGNVHSSKIVLQK